MSTANSVDLKLEARLLARNRWRALFGSHEDALAARLRAIAAGLMGALDRHPDEPDLAT